MNVLAMKCLRSLVGESRMDRVRNEEVSRIAGIERNCRADQRALRWFGHVERMDEFGQKGVDGGCKWRAGTGYTDGSTSGLLRSTSPVLCAGEVPPNRDADRQRSCFRRVSLERYGLGQQKDDSGSCATNCELLGSSGEPCICR